MSLEKYREGNKPPLTETVIMLNTSVLVASGGVLLSITGGNYISDGNSIKGSRFFI